MITKFHRPYIMKIFRSLGLSLLLLSPAMAQQAHVRIISKPVDTKISVDGKLMGKTPLTLNIKPGEHLLLAEKENYIPTKQTLDLDPNEQKKCEIHLTPVNGLILIHSDPSGAEVEIDGASRGKTPLFISDLPLGKYRARFVKAAYIPKEIEIKVTKRSPIKFDITLTSDSATLAVNSDPQGAAVTVNGIKRGTTPCRVERIPSGNSTLEVDLEGFDHYKQRLVLSAGENQDITAVLKAIPSNLGIVSIPTGARIYIDNQFKGSAPLTLKKILPGTYRVRAEMVAHDTLARNIEIGRAQDITEEFRMHPNAGSIEITTEPAGVTIMVGGKVVGITEAGTNRTDRISKTLTANLIPCGAQTLKITKPGYFAKEAEITIERNRTYSHHFKLKRRFIPNYEIKTAHEVYRGVLIEVDANRNVKLETRPGIFKTIKRREIISFSPLREEDLKKEL